MSVVAPKIELTPEAQAKAEAKAEAQAEEERLREEKKAEKQARREALAVEQEERRVAKLKRKADNEVVRREQDEKRQLKLKRKADNIAAAEQARAAKRVKQEEKAAERAAKKAQNDAADLVQRKQKASCAATVRVDFGAIISHVRGLAGESAKVQVKGFTPSMTIDFADAAAAQAFVQNHKEDVSASVALTMRAAPHPGRMLHFPKGADLGTRNEAIAALRTALDGISMTYDFVEAFGPNLAVQFATDNEASAALGRLQNEALVLGGGAVDNSSIVAGIPPRTGGKRKGPKQKGVIKADASSAAPMEDQ